MDIDLWGSERLYVDGNKVDCRVLVNRDALRLLLEWYSDSQCLVDRERQLEDEDFDVPDVFRQRPGSDIREAFRLLSRQIWDEVTTFACKHGRHHDDMFCQLCGHSFTQPQSRKDK